MAYLLLSNWFRSEFVNTKCFECILRRCKLVVVLYEAPENSSLRLLGHHVRNLV